MNDAARSPPPFVFAEEHAPVPLALGKRRARLARINMSESHSRVTIATVTLESGRPALLLFLLSRSRTRAHTLLPYT